MGEHILNIVFYVFCFVHSQDLTGGAFEANLDSLKLKEGQDFYFFSWQALYKLEVFLWFLFSENLKVDMKMQEQKACIHMYYNRFGCQLLPVMHQKSIESATNWWPCWALQNMRNDFIARIGFIVSLQELISVKTVIRKCVRYHCRVNGSESYLRENKGIITRAM